jgi:hypothetical protein
MLLQVLDARLDARVDAMMQAGLVKEVEALYHTLCTDTKQGQQSSNNASTAKTDSSSASHSNMVCDHNASISTDNAASSNSSVAAMETKADSGKQHSGVTALNFGYGICQSLGFKEFEPYLRLKYEVMHCSSGVPAFVSTECTTR